MERHEWKDRSGFPWAVEMDAATHSSGHQEARFVETASYGSLARSHSEIGAEILRLAARVRELEEQYTALDRRHAVSIRLCAEHYGVRDKLRDEVIARERDVAALRSERDEAIALADDPSRAHGTGALDDFCARIAAREGS